MTPSPWPRSPGSGRRSSPASRSSASTSTQPPLCSSAPPAGPRTWTSTSSATRSRPFSTTSAGSLRPRSITTTWTSSSSTWPTTRRLRKASCRPSSSTAPPTRPRRHVEQTHTGSHHRLRERCRLRAARAGPPARRGRDTTARGLQLGVPDGHQRQHHRHHGLQAAPELTSIPHARRPPEQICSGGLRHVVSGPVVVIQTHRDLSRVLIRASELISIHPATLGKVEADGLETLTGFDDRIIHFLRLRVTDRARCLIRRNIGVCRGGGACERTLRLEHGPALHPR